MVFSSVFAYLSSELVSLIRYLNRYYKLKKEAERFKDNKKILKKYMKIKKIL